MTTTDDPPERVRTADVHGLTVIICARCGEDDGPFTPDGLCENCARVVAL